MGFGASLAFIAIGAVLAFAVTWDVPGIDLQMIGWILMGVGVVGALLTGLYTRLYTRRPHAEEVVEVAGPDVMYTTDPGAEPHAHLRENESHSSVDPHRHHAHVRSETTTERLHHEDI